MKKTEEAKPKSLADISTDALKLRGFEIYNNIELSVAVVEKHKASIEQGYKEVAVINNELRRRAAAQAHAESVADVPPAAPAVSQETPAEPAAPKSKSEQRRIAAMKGNKNNGGRKK